MVDWKLVAEAFEKYNDIKAAIPALESSFASISNSVEKIKKVFNDEQAKLKDLMDQKDSILSALYKEKDELIKDLNKLKDEANSIKGEAEKVLNLAKLKDIEASNKMEQASSLLINLNKTAGELDVKKQILKGIVEKLG